MIKRLVKWLWLMNMRRRGLQIGPGCRVHGFPDFGSEPYLVSIGRSVGIAKGVIFVTHDGGTNVIRNGDRYRNVIKFGRITVGDNCSIGTKAIILPGVHIGPNAIIGAGSVVTKDVPPGTVAAGNPARILCSVNEYAEAALGSTPEYNPARYSRNKRAELLRIFPQPW